MTSWTLEYILNSTTLDQLVLIHKHAIDFEETKAIILLNKVAELLTGTKTKKKNIDKEITSDKPDKKKFKLYYGNIIKTPGKKE